MAALYLILVFPLQGLGLKLLETRQRIRSGAILPQIQDREAQADEGSCQADWHCVKRSAAFRKDQNENPT